MVGDLQDQPAQGSPLTSAVALGVRLLPEPMLRRLLPRRMRWDPSAMRVPTPPSSAIRVMIAPVNFAGQGFQWARAIERLRDVGAVSVAHVGPGEFGYPVDVAVPVNAYIFSRTWQRAERAVIVDGFTHLLVEAGRRPYGRPYDTTVAGQVNDLRAAGVRVAMVCHGSEIRLPSRHAELEPDSPFRLGLWEATPVLHHQAEQNRKLLDDVGAPVFVSTPDLLLDVPYATWLPVVVEPERWRRSTALFSRERPVVAHAPSSAVVKGSELIEPVLRRMHDAGDIEYRRIVDARADQMPAIFGDADIVLDQFRLGSYGVAAVEALAAGCIVVGHVTDFVRDTVRAQTGRVLPIIQSRADDIEHTLRAILGDRERFTAELDERVSFVQAVHDGALAAEVLRPFLTADRVPHD